MSQLRNKNTNEISFTAIIFGFVFLVMAFIFTILSWIYAPMMPYAVIEYCAAILLLQIIFYQKFLPNKKTQSTTR